MGGGLTELAHLYLFTLSAPLQRPKRDKEEDLLPIRVRRVQQHTTATNSRTFLTYPLRVITGLANMLCCFPEDEYVMEQVHLHTEYCQQHYNWNHGQEWFTHLLFRHMTPNQLVAVK